MTADVEGGARRPRGGMAGLASNLTQRADSLARRSTEQSIIEAPQETTGAKDAPPAERAGRVAVAAKVEAPSARRARSDVAAVPSASHRPIAGPEGRLDASGERVVKWTLELAPQLVQALNVWERDETRRLGQRVFRERMIDLALDSLPTNLDQILAVVEALPAELRNAPGEQFGTRVRASVRAKLMSFRPELRVAGVKHVRIRDIYSAGVYQYLASVDVAVPLSTTNE